jgi:hypothetical protein
MKTPTGNRPGLFFVHDTAEGHTRCSGCARFGPAAKGDARGEGVRQCVLAPTATTENELIAGVSVSEALAANGKAGGAAHVGGG